MSSASLFRRPSLSPARVPVADWIESLLVGPARFAGFWSAVVIPFALLGLVVSGEAVAQPALFVGLLVANLVSLRLGHRYNRE